MFPQSERSLYLRKAVWVDLWGGDSLVKLPILWAFCDYPRPSEDPAWPRHTLDPALPARCES